MTAATFYRTAFGSHRHADYYCANSRRAIGSGDPIVIPAAEVADWLPCEFCCVLTKADVERIEAAAITAEEKANQMCPNTGTKRPGSRRLYDDCKDCGKNGKVLPNGCLRAHKPQH